MNTRNWIIIEGNNKTGKSTYIKSQKGFKIIEFPNDKNKKYKYKDYIKEIVKFTNDNFSKGDKYLISRSFISTFVYDKKDRLKLLYSKGFKKMLKATKEIYWFKKTNGKDLIDERFCATFNLLVDDGLLSQPFLKKDIDTKKGVEVWVYEVSEKTLN